MPSESLLSEMRIGYLFVLLTAVCSAETDTLNVGPETICWGYYWAKAKPVLKVHSGDRVKIQTVSGDPARLQAAGMNADDIQPELKRIYDRVPTSKRGPGGHLSHWPRVHRRS